MSELITNVVTSLKSLRDQYQDGLKGIPDYSAFQLIQSSTGTVAQALNVTSGADRSSKAAQIIEALELAQERFKEHLAGVPEYRVLLEINKLVATLSNGLEVQDTSPL